MTRHIPVMLEQVVEILHPRNDDIFVDATFGRGGYSHALLKKSNCTVIGIDRDPDAVAASKNLCLQNGNRLTVVLGLFSQLDKLLVEQKIYAVDGIVFDLGVSSPQLDEEERGFSFKHDGPLDMRMGKSGETAADFINSASESHIAQVLWEYGEERASRRIARAIVKARNESPILRTASLARIIHSVMPKKAQHIDPATRSFQAIRIHINNELDEILKGLHAAEAMLKPGGRLVVVSFHSLEDRIVKNFLIKQSGNVPRPSRHLPEGNHIIPRFTLKQRKPVYPTTDEIAANPRARSARLRYAIRNSTASGQELQQMEETIC